MLTRLQLSSAPTQAAEAIRQALARGEYPPGSRLPEEQLASQLGISRVPVREALSALVAQGLLEKRQRGVYVPVLEAKDLSQIYLARAALENVLYERAAPHFTSRDISELRQIEHQVERAARSASLLKLTEANRALHFAMMQRASLPLILELVATLWDRSTPYRAYYWLTDEHRDVTVREHRLIVQACERGDGAELARLNAQHRQELLSGEHPWLTYDEDPSRISRTAARG